MAPRKQAATLGEDELIERTEIYRQILDAIADMVLVKGAGSRILWANRAFCEYYGMTNEELRNIIDAPFNEPDYTQQYIRDDQKVYTTGCTLDIPEEPVTRHDGVEQVFHTVKSPLRDEHGAVRMTVGVSRNITEQKRNNEELARYRLELESRVASRTAELTELSNGLQTILASLAEGIVAVDGTGIIRLMNAAAETLTGWSHREAEGRRWLEIFDFEEEAVWDGAGSAVLAGTAPPGLIRGLTGWLRGRGGTRIVSIAASPLEAPGDTPVGSVLVIRDISLEREVEARRLRQQKLESVGLLAGGIAHDFNNSLMGILGSLTIARLKIRSGADPTPVLLQAESACLRAQGLTTQLLTFAKGGTPVKKSLHITRVVQEAAELALHGTSVKLRFARTAEFDTVEADEGQIAQVVTNLVQNARQASPRDNEVEVRVGSVTLADGDSLPLAPGRYVVVEVADRGVGIAPEHLSRIFDPYFTTRSEGNGLGLASVHSIVRAHGGHTSVESTPGSGSRFLVHLPAAERGRQGEATPVPSAKAGVRRKILVLDDDPSVRDALQAMLVSLGHEVVVTATSREAFAARQEACRSGRPFEIACIDLTMPGDLDGAKVIARLREEDPVLEILVISGYSVDPVMARQRELRLLGALQKPFTLEQLEAVLNRR